MSSRGSLRQSAAVGLSMGFAIVIAVVGFLAVSNLQDGFSQKVSVRTTFNDANGLTRGAAVWFSGVPVGTVRKLSLVKSSEIDVQMAIDPEHARVIPPDVHAYISTDGFIGNTIVVFKGGSEGEAGLVEGSVLEADPTLTAEQLIEEVRTTNEQIQQIAADIKVVTGRLSAGEGTAGKLLAEDDLHTQITATVGDLSQVASNTRSATAQLSRFTRDLNSPSSLTYQLTHDETTYPALQSSVESLQQTAASLAAATDDTDTPIGVLMQSQPGAEDLEGTLENLHDSTVLLESTLAAAQESWWLRRLEKKRKRREGE